jgi:capsular exopolysaccharide synthesis family protein
MFAYSQLTPKVYPLRSSIQLHGNYLASQLAKSGLPQADFSTELIDNALSPEALSKVVRKLNGSQSALLETQDDPVAALRRQLSMDVDVAADKIVIGVDSPFPHEAAAAVNAVVGMMVDPHYPRAGLLDSTAVIDPAMVSRIEPASAHVTPIGVSWREMLAISVGAGLVLGTVISLYRGQRIFSPHQIEEVIGLRSAGYLPRVSRKLSLAGRSLAAHTDPTCEVAVQCRSWLLRLLKGKLHNQNGALLVTSSSRGEGRSTVALNLAATLALTGENVLIVDADIHSPIIHKLLGQADVSLGFCEALDNPSAASDFVRQTHIDNLGLLSCGNPSTATAAKMQGDSLVMLMSTLHGRYRYVVFDGGPLLGNPDALALASHCGAALLVCHAQRTTMVKAVEAARYLRDTAGGQAFAIVNELPTYLGRKYFNSQPLTPVRQTVDDHDEISDYGLVMY